MELRHRGNNSTNGMNDEWEICYSVRKWQIIMKRIAIKNTPQLRVLNILKKDRDKDID